MKKLLLLGGSRFLAPVIEKAHELGVFVITADYLPENYAHRYADKYMNVSVVDKEQVLVEAIKNNIDGVMSFACDPGVLTAAYVAEKMHLPSVGSYNSVKILQNKGKFRRFLADNGFNVPVSKSYSKCEEALREMKDYTFPVIVKPIDSAGSKGVSKVNNLEELESAIHVAMEYSISSEFVVEEFITPVGHPSDADGFSINGKLKYMSFNNQYFDKNAANPFVPAGFSWPTMLPINVQEELRTEVQRLIDLLKMETAVYNIETRVGQNGKLYIMEVSPRGGGNRLSEIQRYAYGVDLIEAAICGSLGMSIKQKCLCSHEESKWIWYEQIVHTNKRGAFSGLFIPENLEKYVVESDIWVNVGDSVECFTGANCTLGTVVFRFPSEMFLESDLSSVLKNVEVVLR